MTHRKLFGTDGIRGRANIYPMTPELVLRLGKATALYFEKKGITPKVVIGKDTRVSGYMLETALTSGLVSMGAQVMLAGPIPTPAVSFLARELKADAGVMISASHNPAQDNGIKIFDSSGYKLADEAEQRIEELMLGEELSNGYHDGREIGKAFRVEDAQQRYREFCKSSIGKTTLKGLKVVLDCANGAGYKVAPQIISDLGAQVITIFNKPDGFNINKGCGATHLKPLSERVVLEKADIGLALDGDADRLIIVDSNGKEINGDKIMAALALDLKARKKLAKNTVVATVMSNMGFEKFMETHKIKVLRAKVGDRYVIEQMREHKLNFGGEQSGHIIFGDHGSTGDGIMCALQFLRLMKDGKKSAKELSNSFTLFPQVIINLNVREKKPIASLPKTSAAIDRAEKDLLGSGRVLVRYSGTENVMRVMVEADSEAKIKKAADSIYKAAKGEIGDE